MIWYVPVLHHVQYADDYVPFLLEWNFDCCCVATLKRDHVNPHVPVAVHKVFLEIL